jgi:Ca-activated chloride channel family protein
MRFAEPRWLWLEAGVAAIAILCAWAQGRRHARLRSVDPRADAGRSFLRCAFACAALAWLVVAIARPRWGLRPVADAAPETDVVIVLDTSGSMLARDVSPDRFTQGRSALRALLRDLPQSAAVGLVRVEGAAEVVCPLTLDRAAVADRLLEIVPRGSAVPGSDLADGLEKAEAILASRPARGKRIVLVSDGEDLAARLPEAARDCGGRGIVLDALICGTTAGSPVPARGGGWQRGPSGGPVLSRADPEALARAAAAAGGILRPAGDAAAAEVARSAGGGAGAAGSHREPADRAPLFVLAALACWAAALAPRTGRVA